MGCFARIAEGVFPRGHGPMVATQWRTHPSQEMKNSFCVCSVIAAALSLAACLGPGGDAPLAAYREPPGDPANYAGLPNAAQNRQLRTATFPRLSTGERQLLHRVNDDVNREIHYLSDVMNYGKADYAVTEPPVRTPRFIRLPPDRYGDCEDYALTKKQRLAQAGFSASRTFVATASVPQDYGRTTHSVLAVPEGRDWWILNNWHNGIEQASVLERWWDWKFIRPRYDSYLLARQMNHVSQQNFSAPPGSGGSVRAKE